MTVTVGLLLCLRLSCGELSEAGTHKRAPTSPPAHPVLPLRATPPPPLWSCPVQACIIYPAACLRGHSLTVRVYDCAHEVVRYQHNMTTCFIYVFKEIFSFIFIQSGRSFYDIKVM